MARMRLPKSTRLPIESDRHRALIDQFDQIASRSNHGYVKTRRSHYFTFKRFLAFLADHSGVERYEVNRAETRVDVFSSRIG